MHHESSIYVAGGTTLIGRALTDCLQVKGYHDLVGQDVEPDFQSAAEVADFFAQHRPEYVFLAAGNSGGILANQQSPADLMTHNLQVIVHVLTESHRHRVKKLLYLASSCGYPREALQPLAIESLLSGPLEPTSEAYAFAKLVGWKMCAAYRQQHGAPFFTAFPANVFGPHDDFASERSHVIPALIRWLHEAAERGAHEVILWGTGRPTREFIYCDDLADACLFAMRHYEGNAPLNLGNGMETSVAELARQAAEIVEFKGNIRLDPTRPDGAPRKCLDSRPLFALGWRPRWSLRSALSETYAWYLKSLANANISEPETLATTAYSR